MKKYDELLKKVEMYEKLAVYGNRKEFLQSLGQARPFMGTTNKDYQITDPKAPNYLDPRNLTPGQKQYWQDQAAKKVKPFNAQELDQWAAGLGRLKPNFGPAEPSLKDVPQWQQDWASPVAPQQPHDAAEQAYWDEKAKGTAPGTASKTTTRAPTAKRPTPQYNSDVFNAQVQLVNLGFGKLLGPAGTDGVLGNATISALRSAKPGMTPAAAIAALNEEYNAPAPLAAPPPKGEIVREDPFVSPYATTGVKPV